MNLFDMLAGAQGGSNFGALGKQFGLSPQQTQSAVEALLPAFSQGFRQNVSSPGGLGSFLQALASGQHAQYAQDASKAFSPQGMAEGNGILGHLFGSKELSRAVAAQASQATGIGQDVLKQMLPALATMLMGSLFKQTNSQMAAGTFGASNPLGDIIEQMMKQRGGGQASPQSGGDNPLGDILGQILGGGQAGQPSPRSQPQGGSDNPLGDILGQILGGGQTDEPAPRQRAPAGGDNPLGDILGQILRGGQATPSDDYEEEQQPAPKRRQPQPQPGGNPLEDIFGKMFNPGGQTPQSEDYQRGMNDIFEQFRRGVDRHR